MKKKYRRIVDVLFMIIVAMVVIYCKSFYTGTTEYDRALAREPHETTEVTPNTEPDKMENTVEEDNTYNGTTFHNNGFPYCIKVNRSQNIVTVYGLDDSGTYSVTVKTMVCSVGLENRTPTGTYNTMDKHKWHLLVGNVWGQYAYRITDDIMFHSVPYYSKSKSDLEWEEYNKLGTAASKGCIRLSVIDAKWIYDNCKRGTIVEIFDSEYIGTVGKPVAMKIDEDLEHKGWDPTDPSRENPWLLDAPIIYGVKAIVIQRGEEIPYLSGITALDKDGTDITNSIRISTTANNMLAGTYMITYMVKGREDLEISAEAKVIVEDKIPPVITDMPELIPLNKADLQSPKLQDILTRDIVAKDSGETMVRGSVYVDTTLLSEAIDGEHELDVVATDTAGNRSDTEKLKVVVDITPPSVSYNERNNNLTVEQAVDKDYLISLIRVVDNSGACDIDVSLPMMASKNSVYRVMYTVTDSFGNVSELFVDFQIK